ncbi:T9SS type A sorting domain-containing protein [Aquimarina mytili]|uniref:T9SS type A sorting domain-containing protein n=1 Tax=Aquimarina mytili TaxID=874423 RepID=A0A936ZLZ6_9FLAO|nr:T9SS type A sorting domain-containing protein [Aquimarina mytili]MBL0682109.1 T9SS type A sorting domain-containing protein [Aquimarina mytili]
MKRTVLLYALVVLGIQWTFAQVHDGDLTLATQAQIDAFNYTEINGSLTIQELVPGNILDLSPISKLQILQGGLTIQGNSGLQNLNGLSSLSTINGTLVIEDNANLEDLTGLSNIQTILGNLAIHKNHKLTSIGTFNELTAVNGWVSIHWNAKLFSINGFLKLATVGSNFSITSNPNLNNLNGLYTLTYIGGHLRIINNKKLYEISPLSNVTSVRSLMIKKSGLNTLDHLSSLTEIRGGLFVSDNPYLNNISGISAALDGGIVALDVLNNPQLEDFTGLENLASLGKVRIINNPNLKNLDALSNLVRVHQYLDVSNNTGLESACGIIQLLEEPSAVGGLITLDNNGANSSDAATIINNCNNCRILNGDLLLTTQTEVNNFKYCKINGDLTIQESSPNAITNLNALFNLSIVTGDVLIHNNQTIDNLDVLSNLTAVRGDFTLKGNSNLTHTGNFINLTAIGGKLSIENNAILSNLSGFSAVQSLGGDLHIENNPNLTNLDGLNISGLDPYRYCDVTIHNNPNLVNIDALSKLGFVPGNVSITANPALQNLDGLSNIRAVQDNLTIEDNTSLSDACGILSLIEDSNTSSYSFYGVRLNTTIANNAANTSAKIDIINACNNTTFADVTLTSQAEIDSFDYTIIRGTLTISESVPGNITNLDSLKTLKQVNKVRIVNNTALTTLGGLPYNLSKITDTGDNFILEDNPSLFAIDGVPPLVIYNYTTIYSLICNGIIEKAKIRHEPSQDFQYISRVPYPCFIPIPGQGLFKRRKSGGAKTVLQDVLPTISSDKLILYPTVSKGNQVTISGVKTDFSYAVYDITGKLIETNTLPYTSAEQVIKFGSKLGTGMYFIQILETNKKTSLKFMVN